MRVRVGWDGEEQAALANADLAQSMQVEGVMNQHSPGG